MSGPKRVMVVFGTRPEAIKMAPVVNALRGHPHLDPVVVVTGQHGEMLTAVLDLFAITPHADLALHRPGQTLTDVTVGALGGLGPVLADLEPAAMIVQGDTTTTFTAALAAFYAKVPVVHVEAGLRTADLHNPFPEEGNRRLTTQLTALHLAATQTNRDALLREGVDPRSIAVTGNTVIDALFIAASWNTPWHDPVLAKSVGPEARANGRRLVLVTAHRRESWGAPLIDVAHGIAHVARTHPDVRFVWPLHANPAVQGWVRPVVEELNNVIVTGPVGYADFVHLLASAHVAVTDSGGVQEEAPALNVPVLITRDVTERHETVTAGAARLIGTRVDSVSHWLTQLLDDETLHRSMQTGSSPYGDGQAGPRTAAAVAELLKVGHRLEDFHSPS